MRTIVIIALLATGCGQLRNVNRASLVASTTSLACDWGQTRAAASAGWQGTEEANPMLGPTPTTTQVDTYFAVTAIVNAAIYVAMPERYRWILPSAVTAVQVDTIRGNLSTSPGPRCGL